MKKKILLISPLYKVVKTLEKEVLRYDPPIGLLNLASFLDERGYECDIVNTAFEEIDWEKIKNGNYSLVGLSVFIGEFLKNARKISAEIKKINPHLPICLGGVMASLFSEEILKEYNIDFVVRYEGEHTLFELVQFLNGERALKTIKGLSYKKGDIVIHNPPRCPELSLDNFPIPRWDLLGENCNRKQIPYYFMIMSSKGCPHECSFCYRHSIDKEIRDKFPVWRGRSAKHIIAEIEDIYHSTKATVFTIGDDNFLVKKNRALKVLNYIRRNNFYIEQFNPHLHFLSDGVIRAMGGIVQRIGYAIESASPRLQKLLNKNLHLNKIQRINEKLFEAGITTVHNFMIGLPTETKDDLRANVKLMMQLKKINPYVRAVPYLYLPLPFTPLHFYIETEMGMVLPHKLKDYEDGCFDTGREEGKKFRPWLNDEQYNFLYQYSQIFMDAFQINNMDLSEKSLGFLHGNSNLRKMFQNIEKVNRPKIFYRPYVLDRVLKNEKIDLLNNLQKLARGDYANHCHPG